LQIVSLVFVVGACAPARLSSSPKYQKQNEEDDVDS